jgi:hypothetical protein
VKYAALTPHATHGRDAQEVDARARQRRDARRLGILLALVVVAIVSLVFAWKLSLQD